MVRQAMELLLLVLIVTMAGVSKNMVTGAHIILLLLWNVNGQVINLTIAAFYLLKYIISAGIMFSESQT